MNNIVKCTIKAGQISINDEIVDDIIVEGYTGDGECTALLIETKDGEKKILVPIQIDSNVFLNGMLDELIKCFDVSVFGASIVDLTTSINDAFKDAKKILEDYKKLLP